MHIRTKKGVNHKQRLKLQNEVDSFLERAPFTWKHPRNPNTHLEIFDDEMDSGSNDDDYSDWLSDCSDDEQYVEDEAADIVNPHQVFLPLPSQLGAHDLKDPVVAALAVEELDLRLTEALDALQQLRLSLGLKTALFKNSVSLAKSQKMQTRAWRGVKSVERSVKRHSQRYRNHRQALLQLGAPQSMMSKFPELKKEDLKISRDATEENRVGQRSEHVGWIWRIDTGSMVDQDALLKESEVHILGVELQID
jgi:hypothetical protein